jgi:hypothetical protein
MAVDVCSDNMYIVPTADEVSGALMDYTLYATLLITARKGKRYSHARPA